MLCKHRHLTELIHTVETTDTVRRILIIDITITIIIMMHSINNKSQTDLYDNACLSLS